MYISYISTVNYYYIYTENILFYLPKYLIYIKNIICIFHTIEQSIDFYVLINQRKSWSIQYSMSSHYSFHT